MRCYSHLPPIGGKTEQVIDPESASPLFAGGTADATPVAPAPSPVNSSQRRSAEELLTALHSKRGALGCGRYYGAQVGPRSRQR
jgi:hypothetical protein